MKINELKEKSTQELNELATELAEQIREVGVGVRTQTHKQSHQLMTLRSSRAQVLTILQEKATLGNS